MLGRRIRRWLYRWIDERGRIPFWTYWFFPKAHWCPEMDYLLILENTYDCFCWRCRDGNRKYWDDFAAQVQKKQADFDASNKELPF